MGYYPYWCIVCNDVEDNGWHDKKGKWIHDKFDLKEVKNVLSIDIDLWKNDYEGFEKDGEVYTYSICYKCSKKFKYERDKLNGSCLKMYTKRKVNGEWIQEEYEHIK
jgi:hypothetical protein